MLLVLSADHVIQDVKAFHKAINIANKQAQMEKTYPWVEKQVKKYGKDLSL